MENKKQLNEDGFPSKEDTSLVTQNQESRPQCVSTGRTSLVTHSNDQENPSNHHPLAEEFDDDEEEEHDGRRPLNPETRPQLLLYIVPERNPRTWTAVNFIVFVWSLIVLFPILAQHRTAQEKMVQRQSLLYRSWNVTTTLMWLLEIGLTVWFRQEASTWVEWIELILALFFSAETIVTVIIFKCTTHLKEQLSNVIITMVAYIWATSLTTRQVCLDSATTPKRYLFTQLADNQGQ